MIYLVRHGETEFNRHGRLQGRLDSSLTPKGVTQAEAIGRHLHTLVDLPDDWVIESSPLARAVRTAEIIKAAIRISSEVIIDHRLREVSMGSWDGLCREEIEQRWPGALGPSMRLSWVGGCPDGEALQAAMERLTDWLESVDDRNRIVVSHGISGSLIRGIYANLSLEKMLRLPVPQDSFFELRNGSVQHIACLGTDE